MSQSIRNKADPFASEFVLRSELDVATSRLLTQAGRLPVFGNGRRLVFTANTPFLIPQNITSIRIRVWGAGGGGGFRNSPGANPYKFGGAGGGYAHGIFTVVPSTSYNIVIGAGGLGATEVAAATAGGTSSFGALISASGGEGSRNILTRALGGDGIGGDFQARGGDGGYSPAATAMSWYGGGGGGGAGSQLGAGGRGGDVSGTYTGCGAGGGGVGLGNGGNNNQSPPFGGGGGSPYSYGNILGPGTGSLDYIGTVGGQPANINSITPLFDGDFFIVGGYGDTGINGTPPGAGAGGSGRASFAGGANTTREGRNMGGAFGGGGSAGASNSGCGGNGGIGGGGGYSEYNDEYPNINQGGNGGRGQVVVEW